MPSRVPADALGATSGTMTEKGMVVPFVILQDSVIAAAMCTNFAFVARGSPIPSWAAPARIRPVGTRSAAVSP